MTEKTKIAVLDQLNAIIERGGPRSEEYKEVLEYASLLSDMVNEGILSKQEIHATLNTAELLSDKNSLIGHINLRPYGYAGDFHVIDRMYQKELGDTTQQNWDLFIVDQPAAVAVRNRKNYFINLINKLLFDRERLELCNVASGPGRDLLEVYRQLPPEKQLYTTCIEMDENAISHAQALTAPYDKSITYINRNIFRFQTTKKYDLIWSVGLFVYFNVKAIMMLLNCFKEWLNPGGMIVIGNFNEDFNPCRGFMELFGSWYLNHRNGKDLLNLARQARFDTDLISVGREEENINLFLHLQIR